MAMVLVRPNKYKTKRSERKRKRTHKVKEHIYMYITKENKSSNVWLGSIELGPSPTGRSVKLLMSLTFNITTNIYPVHVINTFVFMFELNSQEWSFN